MPVIRVDELDYSPWGGGWLNDDSLVLREYGPITHASWPLAEPVAYALEGVDPLEFLVIKTKPPVDPEEGQGEYTLLTSGRRNTDDVVQLR